MTTSRCLTPEDPDYPARLLALDAPPAHLTTLGEMTKAPTIAVVGTRKPSEEATAFTRELATAIVEHGGIVASGGALGIDGAAHEATLDAGGVTWVVAATGADEVFPPENSLLFARVPAERGVMIWPFDLGKKADPRSFFERNGVLVALADAVVIVQAGMPSGTLNAARWARKLGRPVWAVAAPPWMPGFLGCANVIELGAAPLLSIGGWLRAVGLANGRRSSSVAFPRRRAMPRKDATAASEASNATTTTLDLTPEELSLVAIMSRARPRHTDEIAAMSGLSAQVVATALLTLTLENVVVEGPEGLFRLATTR